MLFEGILAETYVITAFAAVHSHADFDSFFFKQLHLPGRVCACVCLAVCYQFRELSASIDGKFECIFESSC